MPILFLIYIRDLFFNLRTKVFSYIDDIALVASSSSLKKNKLILEREAKKLYELGAQNAIQFDLAKTELIHFSTEELASTTTITLPNQEVVQPSTTAK